MDRSRRQLLALLGLGPACLAGTGVAAWPANASGAVEPLDAAASLRVRNALAFVNSVNRDFHLLGLPPLTPDYVKQALGQATASSHLA
jgi:hypothetical protein